MCQNLVAWTSVGVDMTRRPIIVSSSAFWILRLIPSRAASGGILEDLPPDVFRMRQGQLCAWDELHLGRISKTSNLREQFRA